MLTPILALALLLPPAPSLAQTQETGPPPEYERIELSAPDLAAVPDWRAHLLPSPTERERIDWIPSFAAGIERAGAAGKPLLFWAMNGHPLGCT